MMPAESGVESTFFRQLSVHVSNAISIKDAMLPIESDEIEQQAHLHSFHSRYNPTSSLRFHKTTLTQLSNTTKHRVPLLTLLPQHRNLTHLRKLPQLLVPQPPIPPSSAPSRRRRSAERIPSVPLQQSQSRVRLRATPLTLLARAFPVALAQRLQ